MTLTDVRNQLIGIFCEADDLSPDDFGLVELTAELELNRDALIRTVLADMVEAGIIKAIGAAGSPPDLWVLTSPLNAAGQTLGISMHTANAVAEEINAYIDATGNGWPKCDALNVHEENVLMLLGMVTDLRSGKV